MRLVSCFFSVHFWAGELPFAVVSTEFPKNCLKLGELSGAEFAFRALKLLPISLLLFVCVPLIRLEVFFLFFLLLLFFHCPLSLLASLFALPLIQFALFPFFFLFSIQLRVIEKERSAASEFCGGGGGGLWCFLFTIPVLFFRSRRKIGSFYTFFAILLFSILPIGHPHLRVDSSGRSSSSCTIIIPFYYLDF